MNIRTGDKVLYSGEVLEVWSVTVDEGLYLSNRQHICASKVELLKTDLEAPLAEYDESQGKIKRLDFFSDGDKRTVLAWHWESDQAGFDFYDGEENLIGSFLVDPQSKKAFAAFMAAHLKQTTPGTPQ